MWYYRLYGGRIMSSKLKFKSFGSGTVLKLEDVPDEVFANQIMGEGYAIDLTLGEIYAPVDGEVNMLFPTGHAIGFICDDGSEFIIHLGIDTVSLNGKGFETMVEIGEYVKQGQLISKMDLNFINEKGYSTISPIVFTTGQKIKLVAEGKQVNYGESDLFKFV